MPGSKFLDNNLSSHLEQLATLGHSALNRLLGGSLLAATSLSLAKLPALLPAHKR